MQGKSSYSGTGSFVGRGYFYATAASDSGKFTGPGLITGKSLFLAQKASLCVVSFYTRPFAVNCDKWVSKLVDSPSTQSSKALLREAELAGEECSGNLHCWLLFSRTNISAQTNNAQWLAGNGTCDPGAGETVAYADAVNPAYGVQAVIDEGDEVYADILEAESELSTQ